MIYIGYRAGQLHGATVLLRLIAEVTNAFRQLLWLRMRDVPGGSVDPFVRVLTSTVMRQTLTTVTYPNKDKRIYNVGPSIRWVYKPH